MGQVAVAVALTDSDMVERCEMGADGGRVRGSTRTRTERGRARSSVFKNLKKRRSFENALDVGAPAHMQMIERPS